MPRWDLWFWNYNGFFSILLQLISWVSEIRLNSLLFCDPSPLGAFQRHPPVYVVIHPVQTETVCSLCLLLLNFLIRNGIPRLIPNNLLVPSAFKCGKYLILLWLPLDERNDVLSESLPFTILPLHNTPYYHVFLPFIGLLQQLHCNLCLSQYFTAPPCFHFLLLPCFLFPSSCVSDRESYKLRQVKNSPHSLRDTGAVIL